MNSAMLTGEENSDEILKKKGKTSFKSNNAEILEEYLLDKK